MIGRWNLAASALILVVLGMCIWIQGKQTQQVHAMREELHEALDSGPRFTGLVFRFDGGKVELAQQEGQSLDDFIAEYEGAVKRYISTEDK